MRPACPSTSHAEINLHYAYIYAESIIFFGHRRHFLFLSSLTSQLWFAHRELRTVRGWPRVKWGGELNAAKDDLPERRRRPAGKRALQTELVSLSVSVSGVDPGKFVRGYVSLSSHAKPFSRGISPKFEASG